MFQNYRELGLRTIPLQGKKPLIDGWPDARLDARWEDNYPNAGIGMITDAITVVDVDDMGYLDLARELFGPTPIEVETRKGLHMWYRSSGEGRRIKPFTDEGKKVGIDVIGGPTGYVVVPNSPGYRFVRVGLDAIPDLSAIPVKVREELQRHAIEQSRPVQPSLSIVGAKAWADMREGDGRHEALFKLGLGLARGCETEAEFRAMLAERNARFAEPQSAAEVRSTAASIWSYKENGTLYTRGNAGLAVPYHAYDALRGNPVAVALLCELKRQHNYRKGAPFVLSNATRVAIGTSLHRFQAALKLLEKAGLLAITHPGGRGEGDVRMARLLV